MRLIYAVALCVSLLPLVAVPNIVYSKEKASMEKQIPWLSDVHGWKAVGNPSPYSSKSLFQYMNGAAELYLAYNFREMKAVRFEKNGKPSIVVEVYEMASSDDAYGVFTFEKQDPDVGIGHGSEFGGGLLRFWKGCHFVTIFGEEPGKEIEEAILLLGRRIEASIAGPGSPPKIIGYLPDKALSYMKKDAWFLRSHIHLNQRFFVAQTNILMLAQDVEAVLARYETKNGRVHILVARYPSPEKASSAFANFKSAYMPEAGTGDSVRTENGKWTAVSLFNRFVMAVFDTQDESAAMSLINDTKEILKREGL